MPFTPDTRCFIFFFFFKNVEIKSSYKERFYYSVWNIFTISRFKSSTVFVLRFTPALKPRILSNRNKKKHQRHAVLLFICKQSKATQKQHDLIKYAALLSKQIFQAKFKCLNSHISIETFFVMHCPNTLQHFTTSLEGF